MAALKCSKCSYFNNDDVGTQCIRYSILVEKDTVCVDCDELYVSDDNK